MAGIAFSNDYRRLHADKFNQKEPVIVKENLEADAVTSPRIPIVGTNTPQFVLISFDGSKSNAMWNETLDFAKKMREEGKKIYFTYFINAVYFLTPANRNIYTAPRGIKGESAIGFSEGEIELVKRVKMVNRALREGGEIGSHSAGHYIGGAWTEAEWLEEFNSFNKILFNIEKNNPEVALTEKLALKVSDIKGFRAPELSVNTDLYKALKVDGFTYDASGVSAGYAWPSKDSLGIWHIPMPTLRMGLYDEPVLAMDYSIWGYQTRNINSLAVGTSEWEKAKKEILDSYLNYFNKVYEGERAPMVIGNHFSKWNDGVYFEALKDFASEVCGMKDVYCTTFSDLVSYLEKKK